MDRRKFLQRTSLATGGMFFIPQFIRAYEQNAKAIFNAKKIVIIQLKGGNDGLNTVVPFTNDIYFNKRQKIGIR